MTEPTKSRTGAQILIDQLKIHGADTVFCVPGESYLAALDAMYDANSLRLVTCRQEGGATMMAEAYGKLTGRPGICFVTRGPGACNASAGLHIARQDSTPLILFVGQMPRGAAGARGVPGGRLPRHVRHHGEMGRRDRRPRAHAGAGQPRLPHRRPAAAPARSCWRCPRTCSRTWPRPPTRAPYSRSSRIPARPSCGRCATRSADAKHPIMLLGGSQWDAHTVADDRGLRRGERAARRRAASAARTGSTTTIPAMPAMSASASIPSWARALKERRSADRAGPAARRGDERRLYAASTFRCRARNSSMSIPTRSRNSAASTSRSSRSTPRRGPSPPRSRELPPIADPPWARRDEAGA